MAASITSPLPHPVLLGDIGGTNTRLAICESPGEFFSVVARLNTAEHGDLRAAIEACWAGRPRPRSAIICGAGPVENRRCRLTNGGWVLDGPDLLAALGLETGLLLNDFEALALSLPVIGPELSESIGPDFPPGHGPRLVVGPGTGLGVGALVTVGGRLLPLASEACHVGLAAPDAECEAVLARHERVLGRLTAEAVLSGAGLARLHRARMAVLGLAGPALEPAALTHAALADPQGQEAGTVRLFLRILAAFAGDMAITFAATGGVFLGGGIAPRIRPLIEAQDFRRVFEDKAPVGRLVTHTPVRLIVSTDAVLAGMAAIAADPESYILDYVDRLWG